MQIRTIHPTDYLAVDLLIRAAFTPTAFGYGNEAELVEKIRLSKEYIPELELVAVKNQMIVGHGLLSEVSLVHEKDQTIGLVLAPLAISPDTQKQGIGSQLMHELEARAQQLNDPFISILGHPDYYAKFGYVPAEYYLVKVPFDVPTEAFMIKSLTKDGLKKRPGMIQYPSAFNE